MYSLWVFKKDKTGITGKIKLHTYEDKNIAALEFIRFMGDYSDRKTHFVLREKNTPILWGNTEDSSIYIEKKGVRTKIEVHSLYKKIKQSQMSIENKRNYREYLDHCNRKT